MSDESTPGCPHERERELLERLEAVRAYCNERRIPFVFVAEPGPGLTSVRGQVVAGPGEAGLVRQVVELIRRYRAAALAGGGCTEEVRRWGYTKYSAATGERLESGDYSALPADAREKILDHYLDGPGAAGGSSDVNPN